MSEPTKLVTNDPKLKQLPESDQEWRERLDAKAFDVLRRQGTERAFIGKYVDTDTEGIYRCEGCGKTHPEYINGCIEDHKAPRRVSLVALDWFPGGES